MHRHQHFSWIIPGTLLLLFCSGVAVLGQGPANALEGILFSHGAGLVSPLNVVMTGTAEHEGRTEPFRLIATREEQVRIEYGTEGKDVRVATPKVNFRVSDGKVRQGVVSSEFSQLDVTGLFLIAQMRNRTVRIEPTEDWVGVGGVRARRIRVENERTQKHLGTLAVKDRADLYVSEAGLLVAVTRSFYENRPERHTLTFVFSNHQKTGDTVLPYRIEVYLQNKKQETFNIGSYAFNVPMDAESFQPRRAR